MSPDLEHERIFLDDDWYVPVDGEGYLTGDSFEGALGFVLRLYKEGDNPSSPEHFRAVKLPRLVADTMQENAYIVEMHEAEVKTVISLQDGERAKEGLLGLAPTRQNGLKEPVFLSTRGKLGNLKRYPVTLFRFEKNERVQLSQVLVSLDSNEASVVSPKRSPLRSLELVRELVEIASNAQRLEPDDPGVVVLTIPKRERTGNDNAASSAQQPESLEPKARNLSFALQDSDPASHWYAFLPSVTFRWADTTLQRAISNDERGAWRVEQHLVLVDQLLKGLQSLHSSEKLHGDIRPANVMCVGLANDPSSYLLGDYGSFCFDRPRLGAKEGAGETIAGPRLSSDRVSSFYAPERRGGTENEAADCAFLLDLAEVYPQNNDDYAAYRNYFLVRLGWRKHLSSGGKPVDRIEAEMLACLGKDAKGKASLLIDNGKRDDDRSKRTRAPALRPETENGLRPGDRIRLRDHMFIIAHAAYLGRDRILLCEKPSWRVLHDSLVIPSRGSKESTPRPAAILEARTLEPVKMESKAPPAKPRPRPEPQRSDVGRSLINISAVTEFRSWSAATDLYGIGAVLLYSVFRAGKEGSDEEAMQDLEFAEMLAAFESVSYFRTVWDRLETLRGQLEAAFDSGGSLGTPQRAELEAKKGGAKSGERSVKNPNNSLWASAMVSVNNIIKTAPGARRLLLSVDRNLADFCFVLHFCLSCIHRRSSLDGEHRERARSSDFPFCEDRSEPAREVGPTQRAARRVKRMVEMRNAKFFVDFLAPLEEIQKYEPNDPLSREYTEDQLRLALNEMKIAMGNAEVELDKIRKELHQQLESAAVGERTLMSLRQKQEMAFSRLGQLEKRMSEALAALDGDALRDPGRGLAKKRVQVKRGFFSTEDLEIYELIAVETRMQNLTKGLEKLRTTLASAVEAPRE